MVSVRFGDVSKKPLTVAQIDEILNKGLLADFLDLLSDLIAEPNGVTAKNMERLYHSANIADAEFYAKEQFLSAYHLLMALRQFAPHHIDASQ